MPVRARMKMRMGQTRILKNKLENISTEHNRSISQSWPNIDITSGIELKSRVSVNIFITTIYFIYVEFISIILSNQYQNDSDEKTFVGL